MRHGNWSTFSDLFFKGGYDAAVTTKHITKTGCDEIGLTALIQRLHIEFGNTFG